MLVFTFASSVAIMLKEMLSSQSLVLIVLFLHHQFFLTGSLPCHPLLVTGDGGCACPNGEGTAFGGRVLCRVHCSNDTGCHAVAETIFSTCVTLDRNTSRVVAGLCPLISPYQGFHSLPDDLNELDNTVCQISYHTGTLCGSCMTNYSLNANSFFFHCLLTEKCKHNWLMYLASFLLLTLMFFLLVIFQPQLVSPQYNAVILAAQMIALPTNLQNFRYGMQVHFPYKFVHLATDVIVFLYTIWNFDSIHHAVPDTHLCVPNIQYALLIRYLPAIFSLLLILLLYICIELHAHNCRVVVCLWKPFAKCFSKLRRRVNQQASVIYTFATFLLLAYSNIVYTSMYLLLPTGLYDIDGKLQRLVLYYDGTIDYFSSNHAPFSYIALGFAIIALLPLVILLVYQLRIVHKCLGACKLRRPGLVAFLEAFQGHFRDGTDGGRDLRFLAALYFFNRLVMALLRILNGTFYIVSLCYSVGMAFLFLILKPYKKWSHNVTEGSVFLYLTIMAGLNLFLKMAFFHIPTQFAAGVIIYFFLSLLPAVYLAIVITKKLLCCLRSCSTGSRCGYRRLRDEDEKDKHIGRCLERPLLVQARDDRHQ